MRHRTAPARVFLCCAVVALTVLPGCAVSSYTTAHNLAAGKANFWIAPQAMRVGVSANPTSMPFVELGTRYGITDKVEVGARIGTGLQADVKISLRRPKVAYEGLTVSAAPGLGYIGNFSGTPTGADGDDIHFAGATLPVYLTWDFGEHLGVTVGPRTTWLMQYVETATASTVYAVGVGTSLSLAWRITPTFMIVPEVSVVTTVFRAMTGAGSVFGTGQQAVLQAGIAFVMGG